MNGDLREAMAVAKASLDAAVASIARGDYEAAIDDLLAARLLLTTLLASDTIPTTDENAGL